MKKSILFLFLLAKLILKAYTIDELNELRDKNVITLEDYNVLKNELSETGLIKEIYSLSINGKKISNQYNVIKNEKNYYYSLTDFFKNIKLGNVVETDKVFEITSGMDLRVVKITKDKQTIYENGKKIETNDKIYLDHQGHSYLREDVFKQLFLSYLNKDEEISKISMEINFMIPEEISLYLDKEKMKLENQSQKEILFFTSERKMFDLGYTRAVVGKNWNKSSGESAYKSDWNANLDYQGGLLFGELQLSYDARNNNLSSARLDYKDIWKNHTLNIENRALNGASREWSLGFYKDRGYRIEGNRAIIRETVSIGSRAELRYMGTTISIKDEKDGIVIFDDLIIKTDRSYELLVYEPDGSVIKKEITTVRDYNKQNLNEVQYTFLLSEDHSSQKYRKKFSTFYGFTDKLTLGAGYDQGISEIDGKNRYTNDGNASIVYGDNFNGLSYVLNLSMDKSFDNYIDKEYDYSDKYSYNTTLQTTYKKFKYTIGNINYGRYYTEKNKQNFEVQYNMYNNLRLGYRFDKTKNYHGQKIHQNIGSIDYSKSYKDLLFSVGAEFVERDPDRYIASVYYSGKNNINTKLENKWSSSGGDFETNLTLYNSNYMGILDYSLELGYSELYKDRLTFNFTLNYDNWLKISSAFSKDGNRNHSVGFDRIIDLQNPAEKISSMDVSRVKITTYVDENNNNELDFNEKVVDGVEVSLGQQTKTTNAQGECVFYNVSNGIIYDLKPKIKKPSFAMGDNEIKIKSTFASTVEVLIPIKPMLNLNGTIHIDELLKLKNIEKEEVYDNILINIKDLNGKVIETTMPDNTGVFDISGLFPKEYILEIQYIGNKYKIPKFEKMLKMEYRGENNMEKAIVFDFSNKEIRVAYEEG